MKGSTIYVIILGVFLVAPLGALAATSVQIAPPDDSGQVQQEYLEQATILSASPSKTVLIPETTVSQNEQTVTVRVTHGVEEGKEATFENDFTQVHAGDTVYVRHTTGGDSPEMWSVSDPYRIPVLVALAGLFLVLLLLFGGLPGIRGLATLCGSVILILYVLLPGIYAGVSPILLSIGIASLIIIAGSYLTHGFNRTTTTAVLGMVLTVCITGLIAFVAIHAASLSGFTSENNAYLNFAANGRIDMVGLLFGGIMIGLLGVLYDIAIGQAIAVEELVRAGADYSRKKVYGRALRIGREHIGALVNTLAIAYVGASLPLLLLFKNTTTAGPLYIINSELFATEIIRILIGSIGLVLAVPITTLIASYLLHGRTYVETEKSHHAHTH